MTSSDAWRVRYLVVMIISHLLVSQPPSFLTKQIHVKSKTGYEERHNRYTAQYREIHIEKERKKKEIFKRRYGRSMILGGDGLMQGRSKKGIVSGGTSEVGGRRKGPNAKYLKYMPATSPKIPLCDQST